MYLLLPSSQLKMGLAESPSSFGWATSLICLHMGPHRCADNRRLWKCRARAQGKKGGRVCFGDSVALDQLVMTVNLHPKGLKSVIKYVRAFLLGFPGRETEVYASRFCCILWWLCWMVNVHCNIRQYSLPKERNSYIFLYRNLLIDYCMHNSAEVAYFFLQSGTKKNVWILWKGYITVLFL